MRRGRLIASSLTTFVLLIGTSAAVAADVQSDATKAQTGSLYGISCPNAKSCVAVGSNKQLSFETAGSSGSALVVTHGSPWTARTAALPGGIVTSSLTGVSCASPKHCVAVGTVAASSGGPKASSEILSDANMKRVAMVQLSNATTMPTSVSCVSASWCMAIGNYLDTSTFISPAFAQVWNGSNWSAVAMPSPSGPNTIQPDSISCTSVFYCIAVGVAIGPATGQETTLAEQWDGHAWTMMPSPAVSPDHTVLNSVSCAGSQCVAVGGAGVGAADTTAAVELLSGGTWTVPSSMPANPSGANTLTFYGLNCRSFTSCMAVGFSNKGAAAYKYNGSTWSETPNLHNPAGTQTLNKGDPLFQLQESLFNTVSCTSANSCWAAGGYVKSGKERIQVQHWNGFKWVIQRIA